MKKFWHVIDPVLKRIQKMIRGLYQFLYYLLFFTVYEEIHISCFISPGAVVRPKRFIRLGEDCWIRKGSSVNGKSIVFGRNVRLGYGSHIFGGDELIQIGDDVMIAPHVVIAGGFHGTERSGIPMVHQKGSSRGPIIIGSDVWIGANSVILSNLTIGSGVIVGAGSVVTKDIPDYAIAVGNPAQVIKYREE